MMTSDKPAPSTTELGFPELSLLTGNCVDRCQIATASSIVLDKLTLLGNDAAVLANYCASLWSTPKLATSWLRMEGDISLSFIHGEETSAHHRRFKLVELMGLTLWAPERVMLAYYSHWSKRWVDRAGYEYERIRISNRPHLFDIEHLIAT